MTLIPRTDLEQRIISHPVVSVGLKYGKPRSGHPEGSVANHVQQIWDLIDEQEIVEPKKTILRFLALVHDACKFKIDLSKPKVGINDHGFQAKIIAHEFVNEFGWLANDLLEIILWHDEPYNIYLRIYSSNKKHRNQAKLRLAYFISQKINWSLLVDFLKLDASTGDKDNFHVAWFIEILQQNKLF